MKVWEKEIKKFDRDLKKRMMVIKFYEVTGFDFDSDFFILRMLGFPVKGRFPSWRDSKAEWQFRNSERVNAGHREWRRKNRERVNYLQRKSQKKWAAENSEKIKVSNDKWKNKDYERYRRIRNLQYLRVKERLRQHKGVRSTPVL